MSFDFTQVMAPQVVCVTLITAIQHANYNCVIIPLSMSRVVNQSLHIVQSHNY